MRTLQGLQRRCRKPAENGLKNMPLTARNIRVANEYVKSDLRIGMWDSWRSLNGLHQYHQTITAAWGRVMQLSVSKSIACFEKQSRNHKSFFEARNPLAGVLVGPHPYAKAPIWPTSCSLCHFKSNSWIFNKARTMTNTNGRFGWRRDTAYFHVVVNWLKILNGEASWQILPRSSHRDKLIANVEPDWSKVIREVL